MPALGSGGAWLLSASLSGMDKEGTIRTWPREINNKWEDPVCHYSETDIERTDQQ